jgi:hypothetical protein
MEGKMEAVKQTLGEAVKGKGIESGRIFRMAPLGHSAFQIFGRIAFETDGQNPSGRPNNTGLLRWTPKLGQ